MAGRSPCFIFLRVAGMETSLPPASLSTMPVTFRAPRHLGRRESRWLRRDLRVNRHHRTAGTRLCCIGLTTGAMDPAPPALCTFDPRSPQWDPYAGGRYAFGTVFRLIPSKGAWTETVLYSFTGGSDGAYPLAGVHRAIFMARRRTAVMGWDSREMVQCLKSRRNPSSWYLPSTRV